MKSSFGQTVVKRSYATWTLRHRFFLLFWHRARGRLAFPRVTFFRGQSKFPNPIPRSGQMTTLTSLLVLIVARQQVLRGQYVADRAFAHDSETVSGHLNSGYGPGCAAPALVDWLRDVFAPDFTGIVRPAQITPLECGV